MNRQINLVFNPNDEDDLLNIPKGSTFRRNIIMTVSLEFYVPVADEAGMEKIDRLKVKYAPYNSIHIDAIHSTYTQDSTIHKVMFKFGSEDSRDQLMSTAEFQEVLYLVPESFPPAGFAGHLTHTAVVVMGFGSNSAAVVTGYLGNDLKGSTRAYYDLSDMDIRTSAVRKMEYFPEVDTTKVTTRNSVYAATGNLIKEGLDLTVNVISGESTILKAAKDSE